MLLLSCCCCRCCITAVAVELTPLFDSTGAPVGLFHPCDDPSSGCRQPSLLELI